METGLSAQLPKATWGGWWGTRESTGPIHGRVWSSDTQEGGNDSAQRASPGAIQTHVNSSWELTKGWLGRVSSLEQRDPNLASQRLTKGRFRENTCSPATLTPKHNRIWWCNHERMLSLSVSASLFLYWSSHLDETCPIYLRDAVRVKEMISFVEQLPSVTKMLGMFQFLHH